MKEERKVTWRKERQERKEGRVEGRRVGEEVNLKRREENVTLHLVTNARILNVYLRIQP